MKRPAAAMGASRSIHIPQWVAESAAMHIPPENWPPAPISTTRRQYVQTFGYPGIPTDQQERFLQQKRKENTTSASGSDGVVAESARASGDDDDAAVLTGDELTLSELIQWKTRIRRGMEERRASADSASSANAAAEPAGPAAPPRSADMCDICGEMVPRYSCNTCGGNTCAQCNYRCVECGEDICGGCWESHTHLPPEDPIGNHQQAAEFEVPDWDP